MRAKRALDKLAALVAPTARVIRDGETEKLPIEDVVVGDLVRLSAGDQVVADGAVMASNGLALDESILTGESVSVMRDAGQRVLSGSFVVDGDGAFEATAVGPDSQAARITATARAFRHPRSPLEKAMDRLLLWLVGAMVPLGVALGISLLIRDSTSSDVVQTMTAGIVNMVPEGLILLVSLTAAVSAAKMARRGILAQQLNAIESLASVGVMCTDKTGTLTEAALRVIEVLPAEGRNRDEVAGALARSAASTENRNGTLDAIFRAGLAGDPAAEAPTAQVPFSSRRRWSAIELGGDRFVLGAPEALLAAGPLSESAREYASTGRRVLAIAAAEGALPPPAPDAPLPDGLNPLGIVVLAEQLRADADETVAFFGREQVALKVISGDAPATVGAIARDAGIPAKSDALNGEDLPKDDDELYEAVLAAAAIGRISPENKARVVRVLSEHGAYVGMLGDGVNDVPALKEARLAIAQGSGTQMARSVADLVLVSGEFSEVPPMVHEGRQILRNIQRVARLFVTKAIFTGFLLIALAITTGVFPLLPRQFTLCSSLTIGIPAFVLALAPSSGPWRPEGFLSSVLRFSVPAGLSMGLAILSGYLIARYGFDTSLVQARTVTASIVATGGLMVVIILEDEPGRRRMMVSGFCALMALAFILANLIPFTRNFFELEPFTGQMVAAWAVGAVLSLILLAATARLQRRFT